jgi:hypothetical protein
MSKSRQNIARARGTNQTKGNRRYESRRLQPTPLLRVLARQVAAVLVEQSRNAKKG